MLGIFGRLFGGGSDHMTIEGHWCTTSIKLPRRVRTPLDGSVSVVNVCVDIDYRVERGDIVLQRVRLSHGGGSIMGSFVSVNVSAARRGEAWFASSICPQSDLVAAVEDELSSRDSRLRKDMMRQWGKQDSQGLTNSLADALNRQKSSGHIKKLLGEVEDAPNLVFTYTKPGSDPETRHVSVKGVSGDSLRALDYKDGIVKSFRIDRITNARDER
jgi:hypothetical protein